MVRWLRICLLMHGFSCWSKKIPRAAPKPRLPKPVHLEPVLCNKRSHCNEKPARHNSRKPTCTFPMLWNFSAIIFSNIFSGPFSLSSPSGTPIMWMLVRLMLSQRSLRLSSFFLFFFLYSVLRHWFPPFCPQVTCTFFCLSCSAINSLV